MSETSPKDSKQVPRPFPALGVTFVIVGLALGVGTKNWALALPFLVLGVVFSFTRLGEDDEDEGQEGRAADDDGADEPPRAR